MAGASTDQLTLGQESLNVGVVLFERLRRSGASAAAAHHGPAAARNDRTAST